MTSTCNAMRSTICNCGRLSWKRKLQYHYNTMLLSSRPLILTIIGKKCSLSVLTRDYRRAAICQNYSQLHTSITWTKFATLCNEGTEPGRFGPRCTSGLLNKTFSAWNRLPTHVTSLSFGLRFWNDARKKTSQFGFWSRPIDLNFVRGLSLW